MLFIGKAEKYRDTHKHLHNGSRPQCLQQVGLGQVERQEAGNSTWVSSMDARDPTAWVTQGLLPDPTAASQGLNNRELDSGPEEGLHIQYGIPPNTTGSKAPGWYAHIDHLQNLNRMDMLNFLNQFQSEDHLHISGFFSFTNTNTGKVKPESGPPLILPSK